MMKLKFVCLAAAFIFGLNDNWAQNFEPEQIMNHIRFLADDAREGRAPGSKGEAASAEYIASHFKNLGLRPLGTEGFFQPFTYKEQANPHQNEAKGTERKGKNVVAFWDNKAEKTIVIGAHYDHLGMNGEGASLESNPTGKIHNGADDNASGVAGLLELAAFVKDNAALAKTNFLFIAFSAEEAGLIGSKHFTNHPTLDLKKMKAMLNMDMIGRLSDSTRKLIVAGIGTSPEWTRLLNQANTTALALKFDSAGVGPSDHTSFYLKDIPVLHFFTGTHKDYHKPSDDVAFINAKGEAEVLGLMSRLLMQLAESKLPFTPTRTKKQETNATFKVTMGIMPDYAFEGPGVRADGVTDGKPAALAGLEAGDVIMEMDEQPIKDIYKYMEALARHKKGDVVKILVQRKGKLIKKTIQF